jgi:prephenate dehydrogenase
MKQPRLGLIGCGLMGTSFALAARQAGLVNHVIAYDRSQVHLSWALDHGLIDAVALDEASLLQESDWLVLAVPVGVMSQLFQALRPHLQDRHWLMDLSSTKADVMAAAHATLGSFFPRFVGAHPIAGAEKSGPQVARADLFQACTVVLTPVAQTDPVYVERAQCVWTSLGARVLSLSPQAHDEALAAVSHLPHL